MSYTANISTNILRDKSKEIDYIVTPNAKEIFDRIFINNYGANRSFNLIGNYGTGKSTFLWALEKNLRKEKLFFNPLSEESAVKDFEFIKLVGENNPLSETLAKNLKLKGEIHNGSILEALEKKRAKISKKKKGLILIIDEFGKFLENAAKTNSVQDLYLLQQISEWVNDDAYETYFIITLHQNFSSYGQSLSNQDKLEWEKVKGRFVNLLFNEPVEQLIFFAGKKLEEFKIPEQLTGNFESIIHLIQKSNLVNQNFKVAPELSRSLYPLDWLSANVLVNSLQRYGQNERSLFSFLNDEGPYSIRNIEVDFFTVDKVFNYLVNTLTTEITSSENPHRAQWHSTFRALERAELIFDEDYPLAAEIIKSIGLVNIFSKAGGAFNQEFISNYFRLTKGADVRPLIERLEKAGIIRFYRHSNKINFLEGTDIDLEQELARVSKEINPDFSVANEITTLLDFPVVLVKRYSFETGTSRFFEYRILNDLSLAEDAEGPIDGYINLLFENHRIATVKEISSKRLTNVFVIYKNATEIKNELFEIKKFDVLLEEHQLDRNALNLLNDEREFHLQRLKILVLADLFRGTTNVWIHDGKENRISSKHKMYEFLTDICYSIYDRTPGFTNELMNKEFLSAPINTARKSLLRALLERTHKEDLGFPENKFPPEKAIYISLLQGPEIHRYNEKLGYYELAKPNKENAFYDLWEECDNFLSSSLNNKRNLVDLYDKLRSRPFKLKRGFVEFWIPMFLIAKKEDYALFHINSGYIPFLTEDTLDLIHKKPQDFLIKSYDVSGLKLNLLESYKELVQIETDQKNGTQSVFLSIFGNFLRFQRGLNHYSLKTDKISSKAVKLRAAILASKDPEDALFNKFPTALGFHSLSIKMDEEVLISFTKHIQDAIREIRTAYDDLLNRTEETIKVSFFCKSENFGQYKEEIRKKLNGLNYGLLGNTQKIYYKRLISPLDDRTSWIKSVADVALGKSLEELLDEEEQLLTSNIEDLSLGLLKAVELNKYNSNSIEEKLLAIRFFGETGKFVDDKFIVRKNNSEVYVATRYQVNEALKKLKGSMRKELLLELLSEELKELKKLN